MRNIWVLGLVLMICVGLVASVAAQGNRQRTFDLVAALDKTKDKTKPKTASHTAYMDEKHQISSRDAANYAGGYRDGDGTFQLKLLISKNGSVEGSGFDKYCTKVSCQKKNFTLKNARIDGALLTGTRVYANAESRGLEAVFVNRTVKFGINSNSLETVATEFGLGFIEKNGEATNRVFMTREK